MYNNQTVTSLLDLIGWRAWHNTDAPSLTAVNTNSASGRYFNEANGIVSLKNIHSCMPEGHDLNDYLIQLKTDVINRALTLLFQRKALDMQTKSLLSDNYLFNGPGRASNTITKNGRFVGLRIELGLYQGVKAEIDEIWTQVDTVQGPLNLYLFHSSKLDPIKVIALNLTKVNEVQRHILTGADIIEMMYVSNNNSPGGSYYLGYYENDLAGKAINRDTKLMTDCCGSNFVGQRRGYFESITPFNVANQHLAGTQIWDDLHTNKISNNNYGLNIRSSVKCDLSEYILRNRSQLVELITMVMKKYVLELYMNSNNTNHIEGFSQDKAAYLVKEMEDNKELDNAINETNFNFEGQSPCFPRARRHRLTHTSL